MISPYSKRGLTNDLYIVIRECRGSVLLRFLMVPVPFIDFDIFALIW